MLNRWWYNGHKLSLKDFRSLLDYHHWWLHFRWKDFKLELEKREDNAKKKIASQKCLTVPVNTGRGPSELSASMLLALWLWLHGYLLQTSCRGWIKGELNWENYCLVDITWKWSKQPQKQTAFLLAYREDLPSLLHRSLSSQWRHTPALHQYHVCSSTIRTVDVSVDKAEQLSVVTPNQSNYFSKSQRTQTIQWTNQNLK